GDSSKVNPTGRQFHHQEQIERNQALLAPHLHSREVDGSQYVPVGLQKRLPGGLSLPLGRRLDPVLLQDVLYGRVGDPVAEVGQGSLNAIVAPTGILLRQANDQVSDLVGKQRSSGLLWATGTIVPFSSDEQTVPTQDGVGCY